MHAAEESLKAFIIDSGLVPKREVEAAAEDAASSGRSLGDTLVARGSITEDALRRMQAYTLGVPFVNLKEHRIPLEVLALIPEPISRTRNAVAYKRGEGTLEVALLDVSDLAALESVRAKTGLTLLPRLTDVESMKHALLAYQRSLKSDFGDLIRNESSKLRAAEGPLSTADLKRMAEELPIVRIIDTLLRHAITEEATDIHIEPSEGQVLVRYRIGGVLHDAMLLPGTSAPGIAARIKVLANLDLAERRIPQDGRFNMETEADKVMLRVSILPSASGEKVVMRLLRDAGEGFTLDSLGFHGEGLERVHEALRAPAGLILVAGGKESGKTTTLYTMLDILNSPRLALASIEDPIEYRMKRVHQTQVDPLSGLSYPVGLRALLRQDANVILIGQIRDAETAALALAAAASGRLVLAGISSESATGALERLIEFGIEPAELASALRLVVAGRLVRRLCEAKEPYQLSLSAHAKVADKRAFRAAARALINERLAPEDVIPEQLGFYHPKPSVECEDGYRGRVGLQEVFAVSSMLRELIAAGADAVDIEARARREGMLTFLEDGIYKAARGITSLEEVVRVAL